MLFSKSLTSCAICVSLGLGSVPSVFAVKSPISTLGQRSQTGNTISGYVFGVQRQPVSEITVELFDEYSRSLARTRTNSSGRYFFSRIPSGRFRVRVVPFGMDYAEQEQEVEIQNILRENRGAVITTAIDNVQRDFYLRPRKGNQNLGKTDSIFVQEVPENAKAIYTKALNLLDNKNEEQALKAIKSAIEAFPDYYDAIEKLGTEYVRLKHFEAAEILLTRAVQINPRGFKSWYGLSYALYSQNKDKPAIDAAEKAIELNQSSVEANLLSGVLLRRTGEFNKAEKHLKKAKSLANNSVPEVHWQLALLYGNNLKRYDEAADELEIFLKAQPDNKNSENIKKLIKQFRTKAQESKSK